MKISHTPPRSLRWVTDLDDQRPLHALTCVAQAGWTPAPQFTETCVSDLERPSRWIIVVSLPGFPPGIGLGPTRIAAKRRAAGQLLRYVRPIINICPATGREMYKTKRAAHTAVEKQQMLGQGKPLTGEFRCAVCKYWHVTGSGAKVVKRILKSRKDRPQFPWNARPLRHEVTITSTGEQVVVVTAGIGVNAPTEHVGQHVALVLRREDLTTMLAELEEDPPAPTKDDDAGNLLLVYAPPSS